MSLDEIMAIVDEEDFDVTFTGGDPLYQPEIVKQLSQMISRRGHTVWLYTGYTLDEIMKDKILADALTYVDTIVDGPFIESLRDPDLPFRGSSNQRIIPLK